MINRRNPSELGRQMAQQAALDDAAAAEAEHAALRDFMACRAASMRAVDALNELRAAVDDAAALGVRIRLDMVDALGESPAAGIRIEAVNRPRNAFAASFARLIDCIVARARTKAALSAYKE